MSQEEIQVQIEKYIRRNLTSDQTDNLWIELVKEPYWCRIFMVKVYIKTLIREKVKVRG